MKHPHDSTQPNLSAALKGEKNICRLIAAWSLYALALLLTVDGNFLIFLLPGTQASGS